MNREEFTIEFVEDSFTTVSEICPNCSKWICFLPDIKSLLKEDCKRVLDLLKISGIEVKSVDRISVKEWTCHSCKTIYVNIREETIVFK